MPRHGSFAAISALSLLGLAACGGGETGPDTGTLSEMNQAGARLALACSGCHGADGGAIASLQVYPAGALEQRLLSYKQDPDGATVMHRLARGYSEQEIQLVSAYLGQTAEP